MELLSKPDYQNQQKWGMEKVIEKLLLPSFSDSNFSPSKIIAQRVFNKLQNSKNK